MSEVFWSRVHSKVCLCFFAIYLWCDGVVNGQGGSGGYRHAH
jgi:hypothetical protein